MTSGERILKQSCCARHKKPKGPLSQNREVLLRLEKQDRCFLLLALHYSKDFPGRNCSHQPPASSRNVKKEQHLAVQSTFQIRWRRRRRENMTSGKNETSLRMLKGDMRRRKGRWPLTACRKSQVPSSHLQFKGSLVDSDVKHLNLLRLWTAAVRTDITDY